MKSISLLLTYFFISVYLAAQPIRLHPEPGGYTPELRKQLKVLSAFFHSFNFVKMKPDYESVISASGAFARTLSEKGS
jgi:hypothetical protein